MIVAVDKVFLETSIFIRYFTADDKRKFKDCVKLLEFIENGKFRPYTSNIVIFEILFVLTRLYGFAKKETLAGIKKILGIRNLTLIETTNTKEAIKIYEQLNVKFPDCLIATQVPAGAKLVSYDADFSKVDSISSVTPGQLL